MHLARISVAPNSFLREMYVTDYTLAQNQNMREEYSELKEETIIAAPKFYLDYHAIVIGERIRFGIYKEVISNVQMESMRREIML